MSIRIGSLNSALWWLALASIGSSACGGQAEVARGPAPTKMAWGDSPAESTSEEPEAAPEAAAEASEPEESGARPGEIDLDAPVAKAAPAPKPKPEPVAKAKPEPAPRAKPEPEPEPEEEAEEEEAKAAPARVAASADPLALELQKRRDAAKARAEAKARADGKGKKPASKKRAAAAPAEQPDAPRYTGSDPCRASSFSVDRVRDACASGGRAAAKRVMKDAIGKATATGQSLRCTNCHTNQRDYALKPDAVTDLTRWLEGSGS